MSYTISHCGTGQGVAGALSAIISVTVDWAGSEHCHTMSFTISHCGLGREWALSYYQLYYRSLKLAMGLVSTIMMGYGIQSQGRGRARASGKIKIRVLKLKDMT